MKKHTLQKIKFKKDAEKILGKNAFWKEILKGKKYDYSLIFTERCDESFCSGGPHGCHCK